MHGGLLVCGGDARCVLKPQPLETPSQCLETPSRTPLFRRNCSSADDQTASEGILPSNMQVFQVRKRDTGRIYAMKVMRKVRLPAPPIAVPKQLQPPSNPRPDGVSLGIRVACRTEHVDSRG